MYVYIATPCACYFSEADAKIKAQVAGREAAKSWRAEHAERIANAMARSRLSYSKVGLMVLCLIWRLMYIFSFLRY